MHALTWQGHEQLTPRMGMANVRRWVDDLLPLLAGEGDPLGVLDLRAVR